MYDRVLKSREQLKCCEVESRDAVLILNFLKCNGRQVVLHIGGPYTLLGAGSMGLVGDSVRGDERLASISSAIVNDVYSRRCLCEGVEPGCLQTRKHKVLIIWAMHIFTEVSQSKRIR